MTDAAPDPDRLNALRARIDALDETLHNALIERSGIIDELIHAKGSRLSAGAIFRPGREADMFRRLAARHGGSLPLPVIEHIWHIVIAAHTALQAPFRLFVDVSGDPLPSWDAARHLVGFAVPVEPCGGPGGVIDAMRETMDASASCLGLVPVAARGDWWLGLGGAGPLVMARTPAIARDGVDSDTGQDHTGGAVHWVLAPPLSDPVPFDVALTRLRFPANVDGSALEPFSSLALAATESKGGEAWLVSGDVPPALGALALDSTPCGGYHRAVETGETPDDLPEPA